MEGMVSVFSQARVINAFVIGSTPFSQGKGVWRPNAFRMAFCVQAMELVPMVAAIAFGVGQGRCVRFLRLSVRKDG